MRAILGYIVNMIPYMIITIPIYLLIRFIYLKSKYKKLNWHHEVVLFLFVIFVVGLASQTIIPNSLIVPAARIYGKEIKYNEVFVNGYINYFLINFLGNIILFMPFGFIIPLLWKASDKKVIVVGFCSSLFIEICQLFLTRGTDVDDLILNTLGVIIGYTIYRIIKQTKSQ